MQMFPAMSRVQMEVDVWHDHGRLSWTVALLTGDDPESLEEQTYANRGERRPDEMAITIAEALVVFTGLVRRRVNPFPGHELDDFSEALSELLQLEQDGPISVVHDGVACRAVNAQQGS